MSEPSFEKALSELEGIVERLEKGGLALNESLALFEKGVKLARFLREELEKAEKKIDILLKDEKGDIKKEAFELEEEVLEEEVKEDSENEENPDKEEDNNLPF
jgi:exodeoxyribonuclease VII small subunit